MMGIKDGNWGLAKGLPQNPTSAHLKIFTRIFKKLRVNGVFHAHFPKLPRKLKKLRVFSNFKPTL